MDMPCPENLIVARNPDARLSCERSTEPMTAEMLGALNTAMPTPTVPSAIRTRPEEPETYASCAIPAATSTMPVVASARDPILSERRPVNGERTVISTGCMRQEARPLRGQALDDLEIDRRQRGHPEDCHVVEQRRRVARGEGPVPSHQA